MNAPVAMHAREPIKLTVPSFTLLRGFGAFDAYWKAELIDGELWGVPADGDDEPESDAVFPIRLTVEQYALLARSGAFDPYRKTELIDGQVYPMSPQYRPHGFVKDRLFSKLDRALESIGSPLTVASEQTMIIPAFSAPQPDIVLTSDPIGEGGIPVASVALVIEVSDSTSRYDLRQKAGIYALAGIVEYWVVDVTTRTIRVMWSPVDGRYEQRREIPFGEPVDAVTIEGLSIATDTIR